MLRAMSVPPLTILTQSSTKGRTKDTEAAIRGPLGLGYDSVYSGRGFTNETLLCRSLSLDVVEEAMQNLILCLQMLFRREWQDLL